MDQMDLTADDRRAGQAKTYPAYRADIDGLRAFAVLPVLFYHAGVRGFSGGYVGVDIFFVISGFLITGILARDIEVGRHTVAGFYRRRILRIFPALVVLLVATTAMAWAILLPVESPDYARSLATTALFASNIFFYGATDYFAAGPTAQPLLHTWSLAIEEQWYIAWPLVLALIGRDRRPVMALTAGLIAALSFLFSIWLLPRDPAATFYLLPSRAWELALGATIALIGGRAPRGIWGELLALAGLVLILACVKLYTGDTAFPGLAAAPPCLGAALLIWTGQAQHRSPTLTARLLSLLPFRFVGQISYSLYLWHWPVIVLADTGLMLTRTPLVVTGIIAVSLLLAGLSWGLVERPFRRGAGGWRTPHVLAGSALAMVAMLGIAATTPAIEGAGIGFTPGELVIANYLKFDGDGAFRRGSCFKVGPRGAYDRSCLTATPPARPTVLLVGDSHAAQLWPGLSRYRDRIDVLQATATGCVAKIFPDPRPGTCEEVIDAALVRELARRRPDALILASRWQWRVLGGLEETLRDPSVRAAHPILVGPLPEYGAALPRLLVWAARRHDPGLPTRALLPEPFEIDRRLKALAAMTGTPYVSLIDMLCRERVCRVLVAAEVPMQFDGSHLTPRASALVIDRMMPTIAAAIRAERSRRDGLGG